ncbi:VOC family protein [Fodinicola feengrottensis]|uniref:VOC family protein n=1 Tax=Fodinicola feengrottensis TaxID=435914 RepID=UPI0028BF4626|nr:VOC family protein [Fodinicola feengrottensis]
MILTWNMCWELADTSSGPPIRRRWVPGIATAWAWTPTRTASGVRRPGRRSSRLFESGTDYFGSRDQRTMLNFRVRDLAAMLAQLRAKGADVAEETQEMEGVGQFGWVTDPEGNRLELWQPS